MYNYKIDKKLKNLVNVLVPERFREESPEYTKLIESFLINIQQVQDSINLNKLDQLRVENITNEDILKLYMDSYVAAMELSAEKDLVMIKDVILVSKDLSEKKGTVFLFILLTNILFYLFPEIKTLYQQLLDELSQAKTEAERTAIQERIKQFKISGLDDKFYIKVHELEPFKYELDITFTNNIYEKYIKPFCHPAGWDVLASAKLLLLLEDITEKSDGFKIQQIFMNDGGTKYHFDYVMNSPTDYVFLDNRPGNVVPGSLGNDIQLQAILGTWGGDQAILDEWKSKVVDPDNVIGEYDEATGIDRVYYQMPSISPAINYSEKQTIEYSSDTDDSASNVYKDSTVSQDIIDYLLEYEIKSNTIIGDTHNIFKTNSGFVANKHSIMTKLVNAKSKITQ